MNEDDALARFGLHPTAEALVEVRALLEEQTSRERRSQGEGDTELMRLFCVQLFNAGRVEDSLLVWSAKTASMDANASIDLRLLCGAGLAETKEFLAQQSGSAAGKALDRIAAHEAIGEFDGFVVGDATAEYEAYYRDP